MTSRDCDNVAGGDKCGTVVPQQVHPLFGFLAVETHRGRLCGVTTLSGVRNESNLSVTLCREGTAWP